MQCAKCGTENKDGSKFCKICGEAFESAPVSEEKISIGVSSSASQVTETPSSSSEKSEPKERISPASAEDDLRERTSPLAVRIQERIDRADKKIRKKLKRGKVWASVAVIMSLLFIAENAFIVSYELGFLDEYIKTEQPDTPENMPVSPPVASDPEKEEGPERFSGLYKYTYTLTKLHDADLSGSYAVKTEEITSTGTAALQYLENDHMVLTVMPGEMTVDSAPTALGTTPEAFSAWLENDHICIQMKGTEQKFFAPGGAEPVTLKMPVTEDGKISASASVTYDKTVDTMNMRYTLSVTLEKAQ